jgi:hypothetical protein
MDLSNSNKKIYKPNVTPAIAVLWNFISHLNKYWNLLLIIYNTGSKASVG